MSRRAELEALFDVTCVDSLDEVVDARIATLGLVPPTSSLDSSGDGVRDRDGDRSGVDADDADEPVDARELLWWLLRMAAHTHRREREGLTEHPARLEAFERLVALRPTADELHAQMVIDATSSIARARAIRERTSGSVLAVGDDDATVLALALLDHDDPQSDRTLAVADVDPAVLAFLVAAGKSLHVSIDARRADVFEDAPPPDWCAAFDAAVTDPVRSFDACLAFLHFARACVRGGGLVFLADHPDWNLELPEVLQTCESRGLRVIERLPLLHAYPIDATWIPDPDAKARELSELGVEVDPAWLHRLVAATQGCTNLYVLRRE